MLDWGCQIFHGTRECQKELFIKLSNTIQSTRRLNHFLVEVKILVNGWHPWSNWLALLPSVPCRRFLMFICVNFQRIDFVHRKKIVIFQSIYKNTFIQLKTGMRTWRMQSSFHDRSCVKRVDCKSLSAYCSSNLSLIQLIGSTNLHPNNTQTKKRRKIELCIGDQRVSIGAIP